ncbi:unnamed protein product [Absidia cylindrospora]
MSTLGHLSYEIISLIISHVADKDLLACSLTNKAFHEAANPLLWRSIYMSSAESLNLLLRGIVASQPCYSLGLHIRTVNFVSFLNDGLLESFLPHVPHLEEVFFQFETGITDTSLASLAQTCPQLKRLDLDATQALTRLSAARLGEHCQQLTHLSFHDCRDVPVDILAPFAACPLQSLAIDGYWMNIQQSVMDLTRLSRLQHLIILDASPECVTAIVSTAAGAAWPHLSSISLGTCATLRDHHLIPFIQSHPALTNIALERASKVTNHTLDAMADTITMLDIPHATSITTQGIRRLIRRCPHLTFISVYQCGLPKSDFPGDDDEDDDNNNDVEDDEVHDPHLDEDHDHDMQPNDIKVLKQNQIDKIRRAPSPSNTNNNNNDIKQ